MTKKYFANKNIYVPNYEQAIKQDPYLNEAYEFGLNKGKTILVSDVTFEQGKVKGALDELKELLSLLRKCGDIDKAIIYVCERINRLEARK